MARLGRAGGQRGCRTSATASPAACCSSVESPADISCGAEELSTPGSGGVSLCAGAAGGQAGWQAGVYCRLASGAPAGTFGCTVLQ